MDLGFFDLTGPTVVDFESESVIIRRLNSYTVHVSKRGLYRGLDIEVDFHGVNLNPVIAIVDLES